MDEKKSRKETEFLKKIKKNILENKIIQNKDKIVIGVSGGPDSIFLLYILNQLKTEFKKSDIEYSLIVAHVNHMIRKEAIDDEILVKEYCEKYNIHFESISVDVRKIAIDDKISEEECGRNIRYNFFSEVKKKYDANKIATAHNADDNAETLIFNFIRGSGVAGLKGIAAVNNDIIRPILNLKKEEIVDYLNQKQIVYNIDKTNTELIYTRNKIRNDLVKKIEKEYNPNIVNSLNRMAGSMSIDEDFLDGISKEAYKESLIEKKLGYIKIDIFKYISYHKAIQNRITRYVLLDLLGSLKGIENTHIIDINELINKHMTGKEFRIGNKFYISICNKSEACFVKK